MERKFWLSLTFIFTLIPSAHAESHEIMVTPYLNPLVGLTVLAASILFFAGMLNSRFKALYSAYSGKVMWSLIVLPLLFLGVNIASAISAFLCAFYEVGQIRVPFVVAGIVNVFALYGMFNLMKRKDSILFSWRKESVALIPRLIKDMLNLSVFATFISVIILCVSTSSIIIEFGTIEAKALIIAVVTCLVQLVSSVFIIWMAERKSYYLNILFGFHAYSHSGKTDFPSEIEGYQF